MTKYLWMILVTLGVQWQAAAGDFRVTTLRAEPGKLADLIAQTKAYRTQKNDKVIIMRHSQGDHWDLLLFEPAGVTPTTMINFDAVADFQHSFLARSPANWSDISDANSAAGLYHIEMFHSLAGQKKALLKQRDMENTYLSATGQTDNFVFSTTFGSDVDVFTIGFHKDMVAFSTTPAHPPAFFEEQAIKAGFKSRGDIGLYLRSLILRHNDTLATKVQ